jgi:hypothetical protein
LKASRSQEPLDGLSHPRIIFHNNDRLVLAGYRLSVHASRFAFIAHLFWEPSGKI